jgi:site-specific DNA-methyltransferase (adenine-specific)
MSNKLYFGDNLHVLREHIAPESVDLVYLDPPFNSNANYNILFKSPEGADSDAQIEAFEDNWHWNDSAEEAFDDVMRSGNSDAFELLRAMRTFLGDNDMMAYLAMMAVRLIELHRVLKPTGSIYLHCDPTASHYLKLLLDAVFGPKNYVNEISWRRTTAKSDYKQGALHFPRIRDIIFRFSKDVSKMRTFNQPFSEYDGEYVRKKYTQVDSNGRRYMLDNLTGPGGASKGNAYYEVMGVKRHWRYSRENMERLISEGRIIQPSPGAVPRFKRFLDEMPGVAIGDDWDDIRPLNSQAQERLGYPTQKPLALLERIIAASSNEGDVVLDPFCGCGTAVHAAQKLGRQWIGIDVTHIAIGLIEKRLHDSFDRPAEGGGEGYVLPFEVVGRPQDLRSALDLAARDKHQFELWALSVMRADPWKGGRKGPDGGIDGIIWFRTDSRTSEKAIVEVKGGGVGVKDIGRLAQVMERERAPLGVFITAQAPTRAMERDAAAVGIWENPQTKVRYPRLQILTLAELFQGKRPQYPTTYQTMAKQTKREDTSKQGSLL